MSETLDVEKYRELLNEQRLRLMTALGKTPLQQDGAASSGGELSDYPDHPADQGTETFDRERDMSLRENSRALLEQVEDALLKIDNGTYGICSSCKKPIPPKRLEVLPSAVYCVPCQSMLESIGTA